MGFFDGITFPVPDGSPRVVTEDDNEHPNFRIILPEEWFANFDWRFLAPPDISNGHSQRGSYYTYGDTDVYILGRQLPGPLHSFRQCVFPISIPRALNRSPTRLQRFAMPVIMAGRDLICCSAHGSGQSSAYLLPILHNLNVSGSPTMPNDKRAISPLCLIIVPTGDMCAIIYEKIMSIVKHSNVKLTINYEKGEEWFPNEVENEKCDIFIGSPGKLVQLAQQALIDFSNVKYLVLDLAELFVKFGLLPDLKAVLANATFGKQKRTFIFSSVFTEEIQQLAIRFLQDFVFLAIGKVKTTQKKQIFYPVRNNEKEDKLIKTLQENPGKRTIVYVQSRYMANRLKEIVSNIDIKAVSFHAQRLIHKQMEVIDSFEDGDHKVLFATGVACDEIDMKCVELVINFDLPKTIDEYITCISNIRGDTAISFYDCDRDWFINRGLINLLTKSQLVVPPFLEESG